MKQLVYILTAVALLLVLKVTPISALGAKVSPLLYEINLKDGEVQKGYIDVSNPNAGTTVFAVELESFKQTNGNGELAFEPAEVLRQGIKFDYDSFTLDGREALRLYFTVDANKLPKGGVYASVLFRTVDTTETPETVGVQPSARVGTLLLIKNGGGGSKKATVSAVDARFLQLGKSIKLNAHLKNVGGDNALAFFPEVTAKLQPYGDKKTKKSRLIFPNIERSTPIELSGSYFGPLRVKVSSGVSEASVWVFAITGWGRVIAGGLLVLIIIFVQMMRRRHKKKNNKKKSRKPTKTAKKIPIKYQ